MFGKRLAIGFHMRAPALGEQARGEAKRQRLIRQRIRQTGKGSKIDVGAARGFPQAERRPTFRRRRSPVGVTQISPMPDFIRETQRSKRRRSEGPATARIVLDRQDRNKIEIVDGLGKVCIRDVAYPEDHQSFRRALGLGLPGLPKL